MGFGTGLYGRFSALIILFRFFITNLFLIYIHSNLDVSLRDSSLCLFCFFSLLGVDTILFEWNRMESRWLLFFPPPGVELDRTADLLLLVLVSWA